MTICPDCGPDKYLHLRPKRTASIPWFRQKWHAERALTRAPIGVRGFWFECILWMYEHYLSHCDRHVGQVRDPWGNGQNSGSMASNFWMDRRTVCRHSDYLVAKGIASLEDGVLVNRHIVKWHKTSLEAYHRAHAKAPPQGGKVRGWVLSSSLEIEDPLKTEDQGAHRVPTADIDQVIEGYRKHVPQGGRGKNQRVFIADRLREGYTPAQLIEAIDGNFVSEFHVTRSYHKLGLIFRNADQVDMFRKLCERGGRQRPLVQSERIAEMAREARRAENDTSGSTRGHLSLGDGLPWADPGADGA